MQQLFLETSNGLMALLVEKSPKYAGFWVSSLCHSANKGLPDNELTPLKERVDLVEEIRRLTTKPIIVDVDTFGQIEHISFYTKWFEAAGAYAIIIEDKKYPKENSLLEKGNHKLEDIDVFCQKIKKAKENVKEMKIFTRLESLIAERSIFDALVRADAYVQAGADGIMIHSKKKVSADEVMEFAKNFRIKYPNIPLIAVPTTYRLPAEHPFNIIIEANHLTRASLKAMQNYIDGKEVELASVEDIFNLVGKDDSRRTR